MADGEIAQSRTARRSRKAAPALGWRIALGVFLFIAGMGFYVGFLGALEGTNTTQFCSSCHSMQWVTAEYEQSVHFKNLSGVGAGCADCHVPKPLGPKLYAKLMAYKDVLGEMMGNIDTKEKFLEHRWDMANHVWAKMKATDSRECRNCHSIASMDLEEQDRSARRRHQRAQDKGETCIDCHKGVAHEEPLEPDG